MPSIIVGTIIAIQEEERWWYIGCWTCRKKVINESEFVDLETDTNNKSKCRPDEWRYTKCNVVTTSIKTHSSTGWQWHHLIDLADAEESFPIEILALIDDPEIIDSPIVSATPNKPRNEATSAKLPAITPLRTPYLPMLSKVLLLVPLRRRKIVNAHQLKIQTSNVQILKGNLWISKKLKI
uniref:Replication protein A 70 kDa DNA-binding subunit B n=1 Tax=Tanacetum cinerariifolium TaxID=118510 RepID=A0A6L2MW38_TANCI|nr:replication protein A 70 kDa DNA-binding subunit B [Tanacetum cinerariifolium]